MIPRTKKLFISYRSSDHREVDHIASQLRSLRYDNGDPKFTTWQDKHDLEAGKSWWDGIIDAIIECDIFVFHLSPEYLDSPVCIAELNYAVERGRPIIPIVLESAYYIKPRTKKPEIEFWGDVPDWLGKYQFLFYNNDDFLDRFERAVATHELNWLQDIKIRRPLNPDENAIHGNNYAVYATATERVQQSAFDEAKLLFRELVQRNDADFAGICRQWLTLLDRYQDLLDAKQHRAPRSIFKRKWDKYVAHFPLDFVNDLYPDAEEHPVIFDPKNLAKQQYRPIRKTSSPDMLLETSVSSLSLMPKPFDWIEIPNKGYSIAKYPVTNAQFAKFIEADGYSTQKWWTKEGWQKRLEGWHYDSGWKASGTPWTEPRYWQDSKWNGDTQPVVGVTWYEAVAFCLWLSDVTGENIMLPTQDQWQYAAQGDDGRTYPWGNSWNPDLCNNNVDKKGIGKTTPVTEYEGKGDSPFGVVDMVGNVWEWCLTDFQEKTNNINSSANRRVLRGGSWLNYLSSDFFRCDYRDDRNPLNWFNLIGFRLARS